MNDHIWDLYMEGWDVEEISETISEDYDIDYDFAWALVMDALEGTDRVEFTTGVQDEIE